MNSAAYEELTNAIWKLVDKYEPTPEELGSAVARVISAHASIVGHGKGIQTAQELDLRKAAKAGK